MTKVSGSLAFATIAALVLSMTAGTVPVSAQSGRSGPLHILKNCGSYSFLAGGYCTIAKSDLPEIPAGSIVYYAQAFGTTH